MRRSEIHPALGLGAMGLASGLLGAVFPGSGYGDAPGLGIYLVAAGLSFAAVIAFGVSFWGIRTPKAAGVAFLVTWLAWQVAINIALQIDGRWRPSTFAPEWLGIYVAGFAAGAAGAAVTWAGVAIYAPSLRQPGFPSAIAGAGAVLGLLLPATSHYDYAAVLLVPWQTVIAAMIGYGLGLAIERLDMRPTASSTDRTA